MDVASLEVRRCAAENEIHVAGDVRVGEVVAPAVEKDRVLPAQEAAVPEHHAVAVHADRQRLADRPGRVLERQVLGGEIVRVDLHRRRPERADRLAV